MFRRTAAVWLLVFSLVAPFDLRAQQQPAQPTAPAPNAQQTTPPTEANQRPTRRTAANPNDPIEKIKDEGLNRSQVMKTLSYLTDVIGPRLTNSPGMKRANEWTRDQLTQWGLSNAQLEPWGPFGRGWSLERFTAHVTAPQFAPLIAYPKAWSPGTDGVVSGEVIFLDAKNEAELQKYKGRLKGAIVLASPVREIKARFEAPGTRLSEKDLLDLANAPDPGTQPARRLAPTVEQARAIAFAAQKSKFITDEGAALIVESSPRGDGGTVFVQGATVPGVVAFPAPPNAKRAWHTDAPTLVPQIVAASEEYNRIVRMLEQGQKVTLAVDLGVRFHGEDLMAYNTVAEIPGTDLKDEVVMLGGHMDSWHAGTGATDNAAGVAVAMEAVRILQTLKLQPRRTIRIALWSGEEQGLLGSRAYVAKHFGAIKASPNEAAMTTFNEGQGRQVTTLPEYEKFSGYFNLDNGTGKIRGVYLQGNEAVRPIFRQWLAPFREMGASTLTIANTGGTDHLAFAAIGLPGFQFIQDEVEYETRTHHSNQDVYDRIQADDMKQAAVIMAAFVYNTAMRDEKLPRKPVAGS